MKQLDLFVPQGRTIYRLIDAFRFDVFGAVACACGAQPGEECREGNGLGHTGGVHAQRIQAAATAFLGTGRR